MEMYWKRNARIAAVLMILFLIVGYMPIPGTGVYAEDKNELPKLPDNSQVHAITTGSSILSTNAGQPGLQKVYFGTADGKDNHEWYVIAYDGKDGSGSMITYDAPDQNDVPLYDKRTVTLFHKDLGDKTLYRNADGTGEHDTDYAGSDLQKSINDWIDSDDDCKFDPAEIGSIYHITLKGGAVLHDDNGMAGPDVENARLWPLSLVQTQLLPDDVFTGYNDDQYFWTRTPGNDDGYVTVFNNDRHSNNEALISDSDIFMRPAVALEMGEILFTSTAQGSKDFSDDDLGTMKEVQAAPEGNDEWKMTLRSGRMGNFRASVAKKQDDTVTISYTDAVPSENSYVSAVIKNRNTQEILYYGRLCKVTENSQKDGKATLKLPPDSAGSQNLLYVFNEEVNGDFRSDYACDPVWMDLSSNEEPDAKSKNTLKAEGKKVKASAAKLKKKAVTIKRKNAIKVTGAKGTVTYKLASVKAAKYKKYFTVNKKNGNITIKKGLKKGTYKLNVKVCAAGNSKYKAGTKTATVTVKVAKAARNTSRVPGNG